MASPHAPDTQARMRDTRDMRDPQAVQAAQAVQALQTLLVSVQAEPWAHDFFALLRRIDALRPHLPRTGQTSRPSQDALRLGQAPELDFAAAALTSLEMRSGFAPRLAVRFFGLLGPQGPMPLHFTEYVRERSHQHGDPTWLHFLNLFHHRLLSLFYRAWAQAQPTVHLDRSDDRYGVWLASAAGLPRAESKGEGGVRDLPTAALAFHAGQLAGRTRHPEALCKVLQQHFNVPVALLPHVGQWLAISAPDHSRLGHAANRSERVQLTAARLGRSANAGHKVWDRQYKFRLQLGPMSLAQYAQYLPGGSAFAPLLQWVRLLASPELRWDLQLRLHAHERPPARLGQRVRLGLTSWLGRAPEAGSQAGSQAGPETGSQAGPVGHRAARDLHLRPATNFMVQRLGTSPFGAHHG
jgi:type VI secretion system protein ImpH